jgi:Cu(I)/Ag(I) efflux system membrane protein CusA/SilA
VMKRIAAPMVGGMISSTVLTLIVIPAVYSLWRESSVARLTSPASISSLSSTDVRGTIAASGR